MKKVLFTLLIMSLYISVQAQNKVCAKIKTETDKFSEKVTYRTPLWGGTQLTKYTDPDLSFYMFYITTTCHSAFFGKGVKILFKDGSVMDFPETDVDTSVSDSGSIAPFMASSTISMTEEQFEQFSAGVISDIQMYVLEFPFPKKRAIRYQQYAECLLEK